MRRPAPAASPTDWTPNRPVVSRGAPVGAGAAPAAGVRTGRSAGGRARGSRSLVDLRRHNEGSVGSGSENGPLPFAELSFLRGDEPGPDVRSLRAECQRRGEARRSAMPPAATTGTRATASTTCGTSTIVLQAPPKPPATPPWAMITPAPASTPSVACAALCTCWTTRLPASCTRAMRTTDG